MSIVNLLEMTTGDRVRRAMRTRGMSVEQLSAELEVSRATLSAILNDRAGLDKRTALALQVVLDVDADWLRYGTVNDQSAPAEAGADLVHPLGLEPRTHWLRVWADTADELIAFWADTDSRATCGQC